VWAYITYPARLCGSIRLRQDINWRSVNPRLDQGNPSFISERHVVLALRADMEATSILLGD
jgi:hypothetical protein